MIHQMIYFDYEFITMYQEMVIYNTYFLKYPKLHGKGVLISLYTLIRYF